jgi:hypothetical protein
MNFKLVCTELKVFCITVFCSGAQDEGVWALAHVKQRQVINCTWRPWVITGHALPMAPLLKCRLVPQCYKLFSRERDLWTAQCDTADNVVGKVMPCRAVFILQTDRISAVWRVPNYYSYLLIYHCRYLIYPSSQRSVVYASKQHVPTGTCLSGSLQVAF